MANRYETIYARWRSDPLGFWAEAAGALDWVEAPQRIFDDGAGVDGRWYPDAVLNACFNCVDRHVRDGRGSQPAIIYDSAVVPFKKAISYADLLEEVVALAAVLIDFGVAKGDPVLILLPMIPRAHVAVLACARLGAVPCMMSADSAAAELAACLDEISPKVILTASCGIEPARVVPYMPLIEAALAQASITPAATLVWQRPRLEATLVAGRDHDWEALVDAAGGREVACVPVMATDLLALVPEPAGEGGPAGAAFETGGALVALALSAPMLHGVSAGDVVFCACDVSTGIGLCCGVFAPLLIGATTVCYEGTVIGTPDAGALWRVCAEWKAAALLLGIKDLRALSQEDPDAALAGKCDLSTLRALILDGEPSDPAVATWARERLGVPVLNHWWHRGTSSFLAGHPLGLGLSSMKPGSVGVPMPGYALEVIDDQGDPVLRGVDGHIVVKRPLPPGVVSRQDRTASAAYETGETGCLDEEGFVVLLATTGAP